MKFLLILTALVLCLPPEVLASEEKSIFSGGTITLGLNTHHFSQRNRASCFNETHDFFGYTHKTYIVATYMNTQCVRSYVVGKTWEYDNGLGYSLALVSGYPSSMHMLDTLLVMPTLHYTKMFNDTVGIKLMTVPTVLVGFSFVVKIP